MKMKARNLFIVVLTAIAVVAVTYPAAANAPAGRYTISGGNVLDNKTRLTWQQATITSGSLANAKAVCASTGFRVPTLKELSTIIDYTAPANPLIDQTAFPATPDYDFPFWSSTPTAAFPTNLWVVFFNYAGTGFANLSLADAANGAAACRCVR